MIIRKAVVTDARKIEHMVKDRDNWLNHIGLKWQNFWVVEEEQTLIACGQLRPWENIFELSSLAVLSDYREKGIGTYLIRSLIEQANTVVYLSCGSHLESFYRRAGFKRILWSNLPSLLKLEFSLSWIIATARRKQLIFMRHE